MNFGRECKVDVNVGIHSHVSLLGFRSGSDCELERGTGYFGINLTGTNAPLTYSNALRIVSEGSAVQAKLRLVNSTNIDRLNFLQIQFEKDETSKIVLRNGNITIKEGSFYSMPVDIIAHLVVNQEVGTLDESSLVVVQICFFQKLGGRKQFSFELHENSILFSRLGACFLLRIEIVK